MRGFPVSPTRISPKREEDEEMRMTKKKWVKNVKTDATHPPEGLFQKAPETIARTLASKKVSDRECAC
jgi:hypothetical protein